MNQNYAHSNKNDISKWQTLEEHLEHVSSLAGRFAQPFGAPVLASVFGDIHDFVLISMRITRFYDNFSGFLFKVSLYDTKGWYIIGVSRK